MAPTFRTCNTHKLWKLDYNKREQTQNVCCEETPEAREARLWQMGEHTLAVCSKEPQVPQDVRLECIRVNVQESEASFVQPRFQEIVEAVLLVFGLVCIQKKIPKFHSQLAECSFFFCST